MLRKLQEMNLNGHLYVLFVFSCLISFYICLVYFAGLHAFPTSAGFIIYMIFEHIIFILMVMSISMSILMDAGRVPQEWNYQDLSQYDNQQKKRYCLTCNVFKPERTHHCSQCKRCVLNMDHHCPWINNCVGFMNRKYFMMMLSYSLISIYLCIFNAVVYFVYYGPYIFRSLNHQLINDQIQTQKDYLKNYLLNQVINKNFNLLNILIIISFSVVATFSFVFTKFYFFHLGLVLKNSTTIENLDQLKDQPIYAQINYDLGKYNNWIQVFGKQSQYWFIPFYFKQGQPNGDGIIWPQKSIGDI